MQDQDGTVELMRTVRGIYERESTMMQGPGVVSANQILMSYAALAQLAEDAQLSPQVSGTYVFSTMTDYETFDAECRELGLDEAYTISSTDVNAYEQSLIPLENLSNFAFWFLAVLLLIGVGMIAVALANGGDGATLGFVPIVVAGLLMIPACLYSQDAGEGGVLKNRGGSIAG